jgi:2-methylcitrate synthase
MLRTITGNYSWSEEKLDWPVTSEVGSGFEGVVASSTEISWLDPSSGTLNYRGIPIERLAGTISFEEVTYLLITGKKADKSSPDYPPFLKKLRSDIIIPNEVSDLIRDMDKNTHPTRLLRAGISALGCFELSVDDPMDGEKSWRELKIVGQVAAIVADIARLKNDQPSEELDNNKSIAECILIAMNGVQPDQKEIDALNLLWVLYADHGLDAPTFTSMVVASCLADPYYNVVAGLSALRGKLLGGTGEGVLNQILPLKSPEEAKKWVQELFDDGGKLFGFGHRMYRMPDPRVVLLRKELAAIARFKKEENLFSIARAVEDQATRLLAPKGVHVNINFYAALIFHLLGASNEMVPCLYAIGRMAGLVARVNEELHDNRLFRPLSRYTGTNDRSIPDKGVEL